VIGGELRSAAPHKPASKSATSLFDPLPEPVLPSLDKPWNTVVAGVGGTGVLTIASLVAMAAHIEGKGCATMNQTGLAQKFGAVTSHVRVAKDQESILAVRIPAGEADLLIGCDLVVSATYECLGKAANGRTHAIINDAEQATAAFILDPDAAFPAKSMHQKIAVEVGSEQLAFVNATDIARQLLGDTIGANLFLLGYAWQKGWVAVGREALERAIEVNGVAIDFNKRAFLLGRQFVHQPELILDQLASHEIRAPMTLAELIDDRVKRLTDYHSAAFADRYVERVEALREQDPQPETDSSITRAYAEQLYRLMAIKDEYEVARLHSSPEFKAQLAAQFSGDISLRFHLAPPLLSQKDPITGHLRKREFGPWLMPLFSVLAKLKRLRGTPLDVFARSTERKLEQEDLLDYLNMMDTAIRKLSNDNYALIASLADAAKLLRGYGHVRADNREKFNQERKRLLEQINDDLPFVEATVTKAA
jgi:indolepyruvate ferredoxin oxidoreductase